MMKALNARLFGIATAALVCMGLATPCLAQEATPREAKPMTASDLEAWLDGLMPTALHVTGTPGVTVSIVKDGAVLFEKGYGYADMAKLKPVDARTTLFRPGSVSKLFTWTAVMQLVDAGKIDLDTDINHYLDFTIPAAFGKPITMRNLMTHTAGFDETYRSLLIGDPKGLEPLRQVLTEDMPARSYVPGEVPAYSNYGATL